MKTEKVKIRTAYDGLPSPAGLSFLDENGKYYHGKTEQCHRDICDIKKIISKYDRTGIISHVNKGIARYGVDYSEVNEFQVNLNFVINAQADFDALPSNIRERFMNDPGKFFEFATNPQNNDEMIKLGLADVPYVAPEVKPMKVEVINPSPTPSGTPA